MASITQVCSPSDIADVSVLIREYSDWALSLAPDLADSPPFKGLQAELSDLPGAFQPPSGCLLLARQAGRAVGCIGMRQVGPGVGEVKRMYVLPDQRGLGTGQALVAEMLSISRALGHRQLVLDSYHTMTGAHKLYRAVGFRDVEGPADFPADLRKRGVFMEMDLA